MDLSLLDLDRINYQGKYYDKVTTSESIPGKEIYNILGIARGSTVRARNLGRDIFAAFKNVVGGEIEEYTRLQADAREQALEE